MSQLEQRFDQLVNYVTTFLNLVKHEDFGRMTRDTYEDGQKMRVMVVSYDGKPAEVRREGMEPMFEGGG